MFLFNLMSHWASLRSFRMTFVKRACDNILEQFGSLCAGCSLEMTESSITTGRDRVVFHKTNHYQVDKQTHRQPSAPHPVVQCGGSRLYCCTTCVCVCVCVGWWLGIHGGAVRYRALFKQATSQQDNATADNKGSISRPLFCVHSSQWEADWLTGP